MNLALKFAKLTVVHKPETIKQFFGFFGKTIKEIQRE